MKGLLIETVAEGSPADRAGLLPGYRLLSIANTSLRDIIDYIWLADNEPARVEFLKPDGTFSTAELLPEPHENLGLTFAPQQPKRCQNNCVFCFIHQLPKGLRRPLYIKDEDYRLSFLQGTYVTLSSLKPSELKRIISQRLSPLYISVHAVNPALREKLLGREGIPLILEQLKRLAENRIEMHTQVVLCPGLNDGAALEETVNELLLLYPSVRSLAIVPLGLTRHREHLPKLTPVNSGYAKSFLEQWQPKMQKINRAIGESFLQLADEFFLKASYPFPKLKEYGDLPQWENGVGMVPWFHKDASAVIKRARVLPAKVVATVVTGESAASIVGDFLKTLSQKTGCDLSVSSIPNRLFGSSVTVSGLVCGADIIDRLKDRRTDGVLLIPEVMLKEGEGCFLDDLTPLEVGNKLDIEAVTFEATPSGFYNTLKKLVKRQHSSTSLGSLIASPF